MNDIDMDDMKDSSHAIVREIELPLEAETKCFISVKTMSLDTIFFG